MRRFIALVVVALVAATMPVGQPFAVAGGPDPSATVETPSPEPSPSPSPEPSLAASPSADPSAAPPTEPPSSAGVPASASPSAPADGGGPSTSPGPTASATDTTPTAIYLNMPTERLTVGRLVSVMAVLWPIPDGGTVTLLVDGVAVDHAPATQAYPYLAWTPNSVGTFAVTASFDGTASFGASATTAASVVDVFPPYPTSVVVTASPTRVVRNAPLELSATVTPDPGAGDVEFWLDGVGVDGGGTLLGTSSVHDGTASTTSSVSVVSTYHSVTARFLGNAQWSPKNSDFIAIRVDGDLATVAIELPGDPMPAGPTTATFRLGSDPGGGTIRWSWYPDDYAATEIPVGPQGVTTVDLGSLGVGYHHLYVHFLGYGTMGEASADRAFTTKVASTSVVTANRSSATVGELPVVLTAAITTGSDDSRTVSFLDDVGGVEVTLATLPIDPYSGAASYSSSALRVGVHTIRARYNGSAWTMPATSAPVTVTVARDTAVHASFAPSATTFYPHKDGFRDSVSLGGVLDEKATVTIRAYNRSGTLKRVLSLGTKGPGRYAVRWNGRTASGTALAAGRYTLRASFKDALGHTRTITSYTTISWRQAVWRTASTVIRYGDQLSYAATVDGHLYYSPDYPRGRTMFTEYINSYCSPGCIEIAGSTTFSFRTTALDYRSAVVSVYGHGYEDYNSGTVFLVNPVNGQWSPQGPAPEYVAKVSYAIPRSFISSTRQARVMIWCTEDMGDAVDIHYLTLNYQYAVWK